MQNATDHKMRTKTIS